MTKEITAEQAPKIHDIESYKAVTGAERFKRTKEEMGLGLSPEDALKRRLAAFDPNWLDKNTEAKASVERGLEQAKARQFSPGPAAFRPDKAVMIRPGDIVIRIRAGKGVDKDYFEHLPQEDVEVELDNQAYGWFDVKLGGQFSGEAAEFFKFILENGLGEAIDHPRFQQPEPLTDESVDEGQEQTTSLSASVDS